MAKALTGLKYATAFTHWDHTDNSLLSDLFFCPKDEYRLERAAPLTRTDGGDVNRKRRLLVSTQQGGKIHARGVRLLSSSRRATYTSFSQSGFYIDTTHDAMTPIHFQIYHVFAAPVTDCGEKCAKYATLAWFSLQKRKILYIFSEKNVTQKKSKHNFRNRRTWKTCQKYTMKLAKKNSHYLSSTYVSTTYFRCTAWK